LKKVILALFSILCLSFVLFVTKYEVSVNASPNVIYVSSTIQEAINRANPGDTIFVKKGTYPENVVVNKSVSLVGEDRDSTIIDGVGTGSVISVMASNVTIQGFTIQNSGKEVSDGGIFMVLSSDSNISYNKIIDNNVGISLYLSSSNVFSGNDIYSNTEYGINLASFSVNNTIYHNNFNNSVQASSDLKNIWDYEGEGNYWSDYTGKDLNEDGIGDTPYAINVDNRDNYPLMGTFSDFNATFKRETYHVTVISNSSISNFNFTLGAETGNKIIRFNAMGKDNTVGFCRIRIPTALMSDPYNVIAGEEIVPKVLSVSNVTYAVIYFTYSHSGQVITIFTSELQHLYNELLNEHSRLQTDLQNLNVTYNDLQNNYTALLGNYSQLQNNYQTLNNSYVEHLHDYSENVYNFQSLTYIFAATTAIFIITSVYLSKNMRPQFRPRLE